MVYIFVNQEKKTIELWGDADELINVSESFDVNDKEQQMGH